ncbi:Imm50 family immunity protein [Rhizobium sp. CFBP 13726]|uniref:Imm50 family immunity protein n=1 Tax=Rhizobium sp. CFBP 13726 TaxID=2775296 RepID=UPI0020171234|nr:Imm50 family immunity protein [Rhizobium sp. CFBP 13726]
MNYSSLVGGDELLAWFGQPPTFHDAEIVSLSLNRSGVSELKVHGWIMTDEVDPRGYIVLDKHAVVTFKFTGIMDLQLDGFSSQNVIAGLVL